MKFKITQEKFERDALSLLAIVLYLTVEYFTTYFFLIILPFGIGALMVFLLLTILFTVLFICALQEAGVVKFKEDEE